MPTYEYECENCGYRFERFQQMSDSPVKICPECKGKVKRLISGGAGLILKGAGFHANDYAKSVCSAGNTEKPSCCGSGGCGCDS